MGTFWNTYAFFVLYANIDNFNPNDYKLEYDKLPPMDKWILSKLNSLIKYVDECLDNYRLTESSRAMSDFTDQLSNWYVRRSRERFWGKDMPQDKINAYMTLYTVLTEFTKLSAPFIPFMAENIYRNLVINVFKDAPESVHLCDFPKYNEEFVDLDLEENMNAVLSMVVAGRAARNTSGIKNRQPIGKMFVKAEKQLPEMYCSIVTEELNVKTLEFTDDVSQFTSYSFKPQLRTLGKKYGKLVPKIGEYLKNSDGSKLMKELKESARVKFIIDGENVELSQDDVLIENSQAEGFAAESDKNITVVLDTVLSEELIEEGFVRELISKIQTMRKDAGFEVLDRIKVFYSENAKIREIFDRNKDEIKSDVLACEITQGTGEFSKEWNINGEKVTLSVEKING